MILDETVEACGRLTRCCGERCPRALNSVYLRAPTCILYIAISASWACNPLELLPNAMMLILNSLQLPIELLRQIINEYVFSLPTVVDNAARQRHKPEWKSVEPLSLTSKSFRELVLEAWFETYVITTPQQPLELSEWPQFKIHQWARYSC